MSKKNDKNNNKKNNMASSPEMTPADKTENKIEQSNFTPEYMNNKTDQLQAEVEYRMPRKGEEKEMDQGSKPSTALENDSRRVDDGRQNHNTQTTQPSGAV